MVPVMLFAAASAIQAQSPDSNRHFASIPAFPLDTSGPVIRADTETEKPFTVAGERGVLVGQQDGSLEAWVLPVKLLSHLTIEANIEGYTVPIDVNRQAAVIEVRPDRTVITYAHIGFTVRQIMFSPNGAPAGTGPVVLFEFDSVHPTDFIFRFTPELRWMWPERNEGVPGIEWVAGSENGKATPGGIGGYYVLHSDYPDFAGAVTIAGALPGILAPYQERPQVHPVELKVHYDPAHDHGRLYPMLMAIGTSASTATSGALGATITQLNDSIPALYKSHAESYKQLLANSASIDTPDKTLNEAFQWAVISIEQLNTKAPHPAALAANCPPSTVHCSLPTVLVADTAESGHDLSRADTAAKFDGALAPETETALVAGYYASADSARPGFGWFFGRDALYTLYAVNGFGDFKLSKDELEFLIRRQREDGKIMHEYSQTAAFIDWKAFPYMYAAADATPLFLLAVLDYVRASGDTAFLTAHRDAIEKAWAFETDPAHDTDGDGIYDNSQGTGWVESWPPGMPHQEIYLALLDQQASAAMAQIEALLNNQKESQAAQARSEKIAKTIENEYYDQRKLCYAFSRSKDGSLDRTRTVYPALAWWDPVQPSAKNPSGNSTYLAHGDECLRQFASHTLNTDWGLRDLANDEPLYDGMSYHQGSVWPLFTGWAALAEYRGGQPLAGYQILMENANLTHAQDLGAVTELLSGDFFVPFGRSTSHQLWSSAMVITPILRGLFGLSIDAQAKTITVNPHLPANWDHAEIKNLRVASGTMDLEFDHVRGETLVSMKETAPSGIKLASTQTGTKLLPGGRLSIPRPEVEVGTFFRKPIPGDRTQSMRVVSEEYGPKQLKLTLEGVAGAEADVPLILNIPVPKLNAEGADLPNRPSSMTVHFPTGDGWKTVTVTLTW
jgi:glycogen debranching enzyme